MTSERIKEIQATTGYPDSVSIKQALLQVWNECEQSHPSPMSAEQVEELGYYYPLFKFFSDEHGLSLLDSQLQDVIHECKKFIEPASPAVKADGWVSVDKEKEFHKVLKCLKNNKVMVGTREDGIYIRLAGRESEGEAFTLHFALAYPFPKLPPHQNKNK